MKGILGKKIGMTQVFTKNGKLIPVTVIEVEPNVVTQIKTKEKDGYDAIQLGAVTVKEKSSNKAKIGHTNKANTAPKRFLRELRGVNVNDYTLGQVISADIFKEGEVVDVSGVSKGKGFQGVIKRYNQSRGPMGHGSSEKTKRQWVNENLPFVENFVYQRYGTPKQQAIKNRTKNDILIDDNSEVLKTWVNNKTRKGYQVTKENNVVNILKEILKQFE